MNQLILFKKHLEKIDSILDNIKAKKEVIEGKVVGFGNGGHIVIPKKHLNKKVTVIIN